MSHKLDTGIPHWAGFRPATRTVLYDYPTDGFLAEEYCHVGQWGTHVDPPGHFFPQGRRLDDIEPKEMILPLAVIDVHEQAAADPDYSVTVDDIRRWEKKHGPIPPGGFVALRTDWSQRWPDQEKMLNRDANGVMHYPAGRWTPCAICTKSEESPHRATKPPTPAPARPSAPRTIPTSPTSWEKTATR